MAPDADSGRLICVGSFQLEVGSRELRTESTCVRLQEQPFEILRMMLERRGEVVTRDELRQRLWPPGTFVDVEHSLNAAIKRLRVALGDDANDPRLIETVPRRGYRFIGDRHQEGSQDCGIAKQRRRAAVLPFTEFGGRRNRDDFSLGLTEEIISRLGRLCDDRVGIISSHSSAVFMGASSGARDIGRALGVDYLLEGGVRRQRERVRITARLIDTSSEAHVWADTYDRRLGDVLSVQADVATRIAGSLAMTLMPDPRAMHARPGGAAPLERLAPARTLGSVLVYSSFGVNIRHAAVTDAEPDSAGPRR